MRMAYHESTRGTCAIFPIMRRIRIKAMPTVTALIAFVLLISITAAGHNEPQTASILQQGAELVAKGELDAAETLYEKAVREAPDDADLHYELAMVLFRRKNWTKAIEEFNRTIKLRPGQIKPRFYLAESYFMASDLDRARQAIAQAAAIAPEDAQVCQKYGEYLSAALDTRKIGLSWLQKARRLNSRLPRIDFEIGKTQFDLTDFQSAASTLEVALKQDGGDGEAAFYLAESWARLGGWNKARDFYAYALSHQYAYGPAYYGLGRAHVELAEFAAAVDPLTRAIALQPSLINAHFQLAKAYRQLGRSKEAEEQARLFAAMSDRVDTSRGLNGSDEEDAWRQVKPLLEANHQHEALELLAKLPACKGVDPGQPFYLLGIMYFSLARVDDAKRVLTIAHTKSPEAAQIAAYLGMVQLSAGDVSGAEQSFRSALAVESGEPLALIGLGEIRYQQQRWQESIGYLERSRTADPTVLLMLCDAYYRMGENDQAALTGEVIRAFADGREPLLNQLERILSLHQKANAGTP